MNIQEQATKVLSEKRNVVNEGFRHPLLTKAHDKFQATLKQIDGEVKKVKADIKKRLEKLKKWEQAQVNIATAIYNKDRAAAKAVIKKEKDKK